MRKLYYYLPLNIRIFLRRLYYLPHDIITKKKRHKYEPPKGLTFVGSGNFIKQGEIQLDLLKKHAHLIPEHRVLDIGSGIGRTALALTNFLSLEGSYEGFDVVKQGVEWCNKRISRDFQNFHFKLVSLENDLYTRAGSSSTEFVFPYKDRDFHVAFAFSVFTHMQPKEVENYLKEISRILKPGGMALATFFIYKNAYDKKLTSTSSNFTFPIDLDQYRLMNNRIKSANVAYQEKYLQTVIQETDLKIKKLIRGYWNDTKSPGQYFQDILIMQKLGSHE